MNLKIKCKILINHYFNYYFNYRLQIKKFSTTPVSCMQRAQTQKVLFYNMAEEQLIYSTIKIQHCLPNKNKIKKKKK